MTKEPSHELVMHSGKRCRHQFIDPRADQILRVIPEDEACAAICLLYPAELLYLSASHYQRVNVRVKESDSELSLLF